MLLIREALQHTVFVDRLTGCPITQRLIEVASIGGALQVQKRQPPLNCPCFQRYMDGATDALALRTGGDVEKKYLTAAPEQPDAN